MLNQFEILNTLPGFHGSKNLNGIIIHVSNEAAIYCGYKSSNHLLEHERTDYDIRTKAIELAPFFIEEDREVIKNNETLVTLQISFNSEGKLNYLLGEKRPLYNNNKIIGVISNYTDISKLSLKNIFSNLTGSFKRKINNGQLIYHLKPSFDEGLLSKRESECLFHIIRGKSAKITADILGLSVRTVESHLEKIKYKLQCSNKGQVIEKALSLGYYYIIPESIISSS